MPEANVPTSPVSLHQHDIASQNGRDSSASSSSTKSPENAPSSRKQSTSGSRPSSGGSNSGSTGRSATDAGKAMRRHKQLKAVGPYILGKTLGKGQTGLVKMATHCKTKKQVAIKIIDRSNVKESVVRKVEREIVVMKLIQHPYLLRLFDVYDNSKYLFLVLEYVEGGELFDYLVKNVRLTPNEARRIFSQIVSAISYCHDHCVCHRDLKPENLLLDAQKNIRVADFGMANLQIEVMRTSCGSPHYAAPEVIMGEHYDGFKADVWSCGVILYALLAGQLPFDDPNLSSLLEKVKHGRFEMPRYFPAKAQRLINMMLERDPKKRIPMKSVLDNDWVRGSDLEGKELAELRASYQTIEAVRTYPLESTGHIDRDIFKNMLSFTCFKDKAELIAALLSEEHNMEKAVYFLLQQRKGENPAVSDDSDVEDINLELNGYVFTTRKRTDSFTAPLEQRPTSISVGSSSHQPSARISVPEVAAARIGEQMRQRTHSDCSPLLKAKTQLALRVTQAPPAQERRGSSPSTLSMPVSPMDSPRASPRGRRRPSGSIPPPLMLTSDKVHRISAGPTPSPPQSATLGGSSALPTTCTSPLVSPPMSPQTSSPSLLRRLSQAFIGSTPQFHRRNLDTQEVSALERSTLDQSAASGSIKRSWFTNRIDSDEVCFLVEQRDLMTLKSDIRGVLKVLDVDVDSAGCTPSLIKCELIYERKYKLTGGRKKMVFTIEITSVDDVRMKFGTSYTIACRKLSGSIRRFKAVCDRLQGFLLARPHSATSPDMASDDEVLRDDVASSPPADSDSAFQTASSPDPASQANGAVESENGAETKGKGPRRTLSKRRNFTRTYPKSEEGPEAEGEDGCAADTEAPTQSCAADTEAPTQNCAADTGAPTQNCAADAGAPTQRMQVEV